MRLTVRDMQEMKDSAQKIAVLTAYDYTWAKLLEAAGVRFMLVGDSLGQCVLGYDSTVPVTMEDMLHHVRSVVRGTEFAHVIADMPFMSYQVDEGEALRNAGRLLAEGGAQSVKLEGGRRMASTVRRLSEAGVPVMGHIGLTPQSINQLGKPTVQGNSAEAAERPRRRRRLRCRTRALTRSCSSRCPRVSPKSSPRGSRYRPSGSGQALTAMARSKYLTTSWVSWRWEYT